MSIWCKPCHRNRGTRTCCAWLVGLVEACPRCGHLWLILIALNHIRGDGQVSIVERPSIELRKKHIGRRSWPPGNERRSPSTRFSRPALSRSRSRLIRCSISRQKRFRRSFRGPASDTHSEMKADGLLTFHRTWKAEDVNRTRPRPEGAEHTHVKYSWS